MVISFSLNQMKELLLYQTLSYKQLLKGGGGGNSKKSIILKLRVTFH